MNILIITPWYPNRIHDQDGNFVQHQVDLIALKHCVEVCSVIEDKQANAGARPQVHTTVEEGNVRVIRAYHSGRGPRLQRIRQRRRAWRAALANRQLKPDLVHAHVLIDGGIVANNLASKLNIPFVVTEHSHRYLEPWPLLRHPELWLARRAARKAARLIPVSPSLQEGMEQKGIRGEYTVIPNVIKTKLFYPAKRAAKATFTFIHVSDFSPNKNIPLLLEAFAEVVKIHPEVKLHLAGNGNHAAVRQVAQTLHLRPRQVIVTGPHAPSEVADLMRQSDVFVLCSNLETQSLVLLEALLSGLPCISSRSGGPADIIDSSDKGMLLPNLHKKALAAAMVEQVTQGARQEAERIRISDEVRLQYGSTANQLQQLYRSILP